MVLAVSVAGVHRVHRHCHAGEVEAALHQLEELSLMCAHRRGPVGVADWVSLVERRTRTTASWLGRWYPGRPVMVTTNDYEVGLYNGDTGVVYDDADRGLMAAFSRD